MIQWFEILKPREYIHHGFNNLKLSNKWMVVFRKHRNDMPPLLMLAGRASVGVSDNKGFSNLING
ncbi:MAG: hypothetical protein IPF46_04990 [Saprospiraceae bacterium]|nr:hypothetical protein [Candidatus Vicinibacter affinis]